MSIEEYLQSLYIKAKNNPGSEKEDREKITNKVSSLLGFHDQSKSALESKTLEKVDMGSYTRLRVEISTVDSLRMLVYILYPKNTSSKELPAVLAIHGHGYGSKEVVGLNPDGTERKEKTGHKNFAIDLVQRGLVVFAAELVGFGDRKLIEDENSSNPNDNSCYRIGSQLLLMGKTLVGLRVAECRRLIDYVQTYEGVSRNKIGIMGLSGGGMVTALVSLLDKRIKSTVISGYTNTFSGSIMDRRHCLDNYVPGILEVGEMPDLIGLIAPRPLFIEAGKDDHLFPLQHVNSALEHLKKTYKASKAENQLDYHIFDGGHEISGEKSFDWLERQLK